MSKTYIFNYVKNIVAFNVNGLWTGKEYTPDFNYRKLFLEEQLLVARFGAMRAIKLKEKINNLINKNNNE